MVDMIMFISFEWYEYVHTSWGGYHKLTFAWTVVACSLAFLPKCWCGPEACHNFCGFGKWAYWGLMWIPFLFFPLKLLAEIKQSCTYFSFKIEKWLKNIECNMSQFSICKKRLKYFISIKGVHIQRCSDAWMTVSWAVK